MFHMKPFLAPHWRLLKISPPKGEKTRLGCSCTIVHCTLSSRSVAPSPRYLSRCPLTKRVIADEISDNRILALCLPGKKTFINAFVTKFSANVCKRWITNVRY